MFEYKILQGQDVQVQNEINTLARDGWQVEQIFVLDTAPPKLYALMKHDLRKADQAK